MFRVNEDMIVDATHSGSASRFINHSCMPNCYSRIIALENGMQKICIIAQQPIETGQEVTYDYKFPMEEEAVPCNCVRLEQWWGGMGHVQSFTPRCLVGVQGAPSCVGRMT